MQCESWFDVVSAVSIHAAVGAAQQVPEASPEAFTQQPRYTEMCVKVMEAAVQQGLANNLTAWTQTVLENMQSLCKLPKVEPERYCASNTIASN